MAKNKQEILVAATGESFRCPLDSPAPTSVDSPLPTEANPMGFLTADGFNVEDNFTANTVEAWQDGEEVAQINSAPSVEITLAALQFNDDNITWYMGSEKKADGSWEFSAEKTGGRQSYHFIVYDTVRGTITRLYVPEAEISDRTALTFVSTDAVSLGVTLKAYKSSKYGYAYKIWHEAIPEGFGS